MKIRFKKLLTLGVLSFILVSNPSHVFAEELQEPVKPPEPTGEPITNEQIVDYNQQVDDYNHAIDDYNTQVDVIYIQEKEQIDKQNAIIEEHNNAEDAKLEQVKLENEQTQEKYNEDYAQYEQELADYNQAEQKIESFGYTVEQYNELMNGYYNQPYEASEKGNADEDNTFILEDSYQIEEGENTSEDEKKYNVKIEHYFVDSGNLVKSYSTEFDINKNDIITFKSAGAQLETYSNNYVYGFFAKTDEDHIHGYWIPSYTYLEELCNYKVEDWDVGNVYTLSYKDGESKSGDPALRMIYQYCWQSLKRAKTYTKPEEPTLELKEYTPEYQTKLQDPVKKDYLPYLPYLDLKEETPKEEVTVIPEPKKAESPVSPPIFSTIGEEEHEPSLMSDDYPIEEETIDNISGIMAPQTGDSIIPIVVCSVLFILGVCLIVCIFKNK